MDKNMKKFIGSEGSGVGVAKQDVMIDIKMR